MREAVEDIRPLQVFSGFALALTLTAGTVVAGTQAITSFLREDGNGQVLERTLVFGTILENVRDAYVDAGVDLDQLFQTGVNSMLQVLDPYSVYEDKKASEDLSVRTLGRYGGVGLTIGKEGKDVIVLNALEGFAFDAGVRPGDRILTIDDNSVKGLTLDAVKNLLRGEPGTSIMLQVQRDGSPEPTLTMPVRRMLVRLPDVTLATLDRERGIGYIKLEGFSEGTAEETGLAIRRMQAERELSALILDLRDNPGGLLNSAVAVSQQLVPENTEIVSTAGRVYGEGTSLSYRSTRPPALSPRTKLVVLVNANTASAAEIVTGVVQDTDRGVVIGQRTFGKGLVQVVEPLPGGASLKLTVAKYYTPSGRCIQAADYTNRRLNKLNAAERAEAAATTPLDVGTADSLEGGAAPDAAAPRDPAPPEGRRGGAARIGGNSGGAVGEKAVPDGPPPEMFATLNGREVKAGGGIAPDLVAEGRKVGELERALFNQGLFFQFTSDWLAKHPNPADAQMRVVDRSQEAVYRDFVEFVNAKARTPGADGKEGLTLEPVGITPALTAVEKSLAERGLADSRSARELQAFRKMLREEQLEELRTQKAALLFDLRESILSRLTAPSVRLEAQLRDDPQVRAAYDLATNSAEYERLLAPPNANALAAASKAPSSVEIFPPVTGPSPTASR